MYVGKWRDSPDCHAHVLPAHLGRDVVDDLAVVILISLPSMELNPLICAAGGGFTHPEGFKRGVEKELLPTGGPYNH